MHVNPQSYSVPSKLAQIKDSNPEVVYLNLKLIAAMAKKRSREHINVDVQLVEIYEDLSNENNEIRLKAAQKLVSRFTPEQNPSEEQIEKALKRLFRGLCSSRKAARIGFSVALTEVLAQVFSPSRKLPSPNLDVSKVIEILETQSDIGGSASGQVSNPCEIGNFTLM